MSSNQTLAARLRNWAIATDAVPASDLMDEAANEIDRLRITVAEREAVELAIDCMNGVEDISALWSQRETEAIATMRGLLERMK